MSVQWFWDDRCVPDEGFTLIPSDNCQRMSEHIPEWQKKVGLLVQKLLNSQ